MCEDVCWKLGEGNGWCWGSGHSACCCSSLRRLPSKPASQLHGTVFKVGGEAFVPFLVSLADLTYLVTCGYIHIFTITCIFLSWFEFFQIVIDSYEVLMFLVVLRLSHSYHHSRRNITALWVALRPERNALQYSRVLTHLEVLPSALAQ